MYLLFKINNNNINKLNVWCIFSVNNFQGIRNELFVEVKQLRDREQRDLEMAEFARELERQTDMKLVASDIVNPMIICPHHTK